MATLPTWLLMWIEDERMKRNISRVWRRLPACDRAVLRALVSDIAVVSEMGGHLLGSAGEVDPNGTYNGNAAQIAEGHHDTVTLYAPPHFQSDAATMFVIAHEFAHVVLRHKQMSLVMGVLENLGPYSDADTVSLHELDEDAADLQAWVWGFKTEMATFHAEFPDARRPRWNTELAWETRPATAA